MESAAAVLAAFEAALPKDERVEIKKMFGTPCAFVSRQMFCGTFEGTLVFRIGPERVAALTGGPGMGVFTLSEDKVWDDYVQVDPTVDGAVDGSVLARLAAEALAWTASLPTKAKMSKKQRVKQAKRAERAANRVESVD